jgi:uncharacterized OB-fold protein
MPVSIDPNRLKLTDDTGTKGVLLGFRCRDCGVHMFGSAIFCQACASSNLEPVEFQRGGTLYSYTIVRVPPSGWPGPVPYILGEIQLPEGPHVLAEIIECEEPELKIGMPMELALRAIAGADDGGEKIVYKWSPASARRELEEK